MLHRRQTVTRSVGLRIRYLSHEGKACQWKSDSIGQVTTLPSQPTELRVAERTPERMLISWKPPVVVIAQHPSPRILAQQVAASSITEADAKAGARYEASDLAEESYAGKHQAWGDSDSENGYESLVAPTDAFATNTNPTPVAAGRQGWRRSPVAARAQRGSRVHSSQDQCVVLEGKPIVVTYEVSWCLQADEMGIITVEADVAHVGAYSTWIDLPQHAPDSFKVTVIAVNQSGKGAPAELLVNCVGLHAAPAGDTAEDELDEDSDLASTPGNSLELSLSRGASPLSQDGGDTVVATPTEVPDAQVHRDSLAALPTPCVRFGEPVAWAASGGGGVADVAWDALELDESVVSLRLDYQVQGRVFQVAIADLASRSFRIGGGGGDPASLPLPPGSTLSDPCLHTVSTAGAKLVAECRERVQTHDVPLPPQNVQATSVDSQAIVVTWEPPLPQFGPTAAGRLAEPPVTSYTVQYSAGVDGGVVQRHASSDWDSLSLTLHVPPAVVHNVQVAAVNPLGVGEWSRPVKPNAPLRVPVVTGARVVDVGRSYVMMAWDSSPSVVEAYRVSFIVETPPPTPPRRGLIKLRSRQRRQHLMHVDVRVHADDAVLPGLGTTGCKIEGHRRENTFGTPGSASTASSVVTQDSPLSLSTGTLLASPGSPAPSTASRGSHSTPTSVVGTPEVAGTPGSAAVPLASFPWLSPGCILRNITVRAVTASAIGRHSAPIDSVRTSKADVPSQPQSVAVDGDVGITSMAVQWEPPVDDGGMSITGYEVRYWCVERGDTGPLSDAPSGTARTRGRTLRAELGAKAFNALPGGHVVRNLQVRARNAVGWSSWSDALEATPLKPPTTPGKPRCLETTARVGALDLRWQPPTSNGGSEVTAYVVEVCFASGETEHHEVAVPRATIQAQPEMGDIVSVDVRAINSHGVGDHGIVARVSPLPSENAPAL